MTKKIWERNFLKALYPLPEKERKKMLAYYQELFLDKLEAGESEAEILQKFGSPEACAKKILEEQYDGVPMPKETKRFSVGVIVGLFFLTLLLIIPLASGAVAVVSSFAVCSLTGAVCIVGGIFYSLLSPFLMVGMSGAGIVAQIGLGITLSGVGTLVCVGFFFLTKYSAIGVWKALKFIYARRVI